MKRFVLVCVTVFPAIGLLSADPSLVKDLNTTPAPTNPSELRAAGGRVLFGLSDRDHGFELWTTDISDAIQLLAWLFTGGPAPSTPGPPGNPCGADPDPAGAEGDLGCGSYPPCR